MALVLTAAPVGAGAATPRPVDRVLVLSLPAVSWADLETVDLPHLDRLLDRSAIAGLSTRSVHRQTAPGDGYLTIGAGARAIGDPAQDGVVLDPAERVAGERAVAVHHRRTEATGSPAATGPVVPGWPRLEAVNAASPYRARLGTLAASLAGSGVTAAVVANADHPPSVGDDLVDPGLARHAALALAGPDGAVAGGTVAPALLVPDGPSPFGRTFDRRTVVSAFRDAWKDRSVVLVEASDLARFDAERPAMADSAAERLRRRTLRRTDRLVGDLLRHVDRRRHAVLVVGPYHRAGDVHLTVAGLRAPGLAPGLLDSATSRRAGFVALADVGPTVLDLLGIIPPSAMSGRPVAWAADGGGPDDRRRTLREADAAARFRDRQLTVVVLAGAVWLAGVAALVAAVVTRRGGSRAGTALRAVAFGLLAVLPATYLGALVPFHRLPAAGYWLALAAVAAVGGLASACLGRRWPRATLAVALALLTGLLVADLLLGARLQLNTPFGYSPLNGGRFAGLPNVGFALLATAGLLLAGLVGERLRSHRGAVVAVIVAVVVAVVVGAPPWGSDVGGVLALVPAVGAMAAVLLGIRLRPARLLLLAAAGALATVAVGLVDLARPPALRTHLGRLLEAVAEEGATPLADVVARKLGANLATFRSSAWVVTVLVGLAAVAWLARRHPDLLTAPWRRGPIVRAALVGLAVTAVLGFALNDSGVAVPGAMLLVLGPAAALTLAGRTDPAVEARSG